MIKLRILRWKIVRLSGLALYVITSGLVRDLPVMEKAMKQKLESGALKTEESAISQGTGMATIS